MLQGSVVTAQVDRVAKRAGVPAEVVAILMIVTGALVILFPKLLELFIGLLLIVAGAWWLVATIAARRESPPQPSLGPHDPFDP